MYKKSFLPAKRLVADLGVLQYTTSTWSARITTNHCRNYGRGNALQYGTVSTNRLEIKREHSVPYLGVQA